MSSVSTIKLISAALKVLRPKARADGLVPLSSDEDDRNLQLAAYQLPLQIRTSHSRHGDVEDQESGLGLSIGRQKLFCRRENAGLEAERLQQIGQGLSHGLVVVDD